MDQSAAIEKARQFARTAYAAAANEIAREHQQKIVEMRQKLAARGILMSGALVAETSRINGEQIKALTLAKLEGIVEGYKLYGVVIDDSMAVNICDDVIQTMNQMVYSSKSPSLPGSTPFGVESQYQQMVAQNVGVTAAYVKTQIDRRRLMAKTESAATTIYYVQGDNARVNVNSTDNSVNVVMKSKEEFFATLRERIQSGVPEGDERAMILQKLTALQESHGQPSFAHRYAEFIAAAANHVVLLTPFIPAFTDMLHKVFP